jgi:hypothetical protein
MRTRNTFSRVLLLALSLVVVVHATGSPTWFVGPLMLLVLLGIQIKSEKSAETSYASLAIGEILVIIIGLSSMPLALLAQILVLMLAGEGLNLTIRERMPADALVSIIIGITAGIVVVVLEDVYLILVVILCATFSMLVFVLYNEKHSKRLSERTNA